jgi:Ca2+-transporting ATPase
MHRPTQHRESKHDPANAAAAAPDVATNPAKGLSTEEAKRRLRAVGPNEIAASRLVSRLNEIGKILLDPMGLMLLGLAVLYAILGDRTDAVILLVAYVPVTGVDVILELRANAALAALKATLCPLAKVLRDGAIQEIAIRELVPGDILIFEEGQTLPADGALIEAEHLTINEAALTGESVPLEKSPGDRFFGGTQVLTGRALGLLDRTGKNTRFGHIARLLESVEGVQSPLKKRVDRLVKRVLLVAAGLAVLLFGLEMSRTGQFIPSLIVALTFGMAAVPEEFPLVFTLYLSLGAWRLSQKRVLVKSLPSVEALGSVDIICTDKTGTLTEGRFQLEEMRAFGTSPLTNDLWQAALMACEPRPMDSMELAIAERGAQYQEQLEGWQLAWDYPFEKTGKHMSHVWKHAATNQYRMAMKGAVEGVLEHCEVTPEDRARIESTVQEIAAQGKRLLGLASREGPSTGNREQDERGLHFLAILIFSDPIRPSVEQSISECQAAGIEVKMLSGDHPYTAHFVADRAGINHSHEYLYTGDQLAAMARDQRREAYLQGAVFSRVTPEQKHEMVESLKAAGKIVAMTGDGINDAPALKLADIGISMGHTATDVARSAAQIVLLDSDFSGIVAAMMEGRRILSNLRRSFSYLISFHVPVVLLALVPPLLGWEPLLLPVHIIILEIIVHPVSAFTFENLPAVEERGKSRRPSGGPDGFLDRGRVLRSALAGVAVSVGALLLFGFASTPESVNMARATAFSAVLTGNIAFILSETWPALRRRFTATAAALCALVLVFAFVPIHALHFSPMGIGGLVWAFLVGGLGLLPLFFARGAH